MSSAPARRSQRAGTRTSGPVTPEWARTTGDRSAAGYRPSAAVASVTSPVAAVT